MNRKYLYLLSAILAIVAVLVFGAFRKSATAPEIIVSVEKKPFEITVVNTGELEAQNSVPIQGPDGLVAARVWSVKIEDIVEEGTIVKKGDYVATLDRTEIGERIRNEELDGEESRNRFEQTQIDTALDLRARRDELKKKQLIVERKRIELENSQFEPPAIIQQAKLALIEAEMDLNLAKEDYLLRKEKAVTTMKRRRIDLIDDEQDLKLLVDVYEKFVIHAPENGMVIYRKDQGRKIKKGSSITARNPVVATLPDLSKMISRCYVNEVDIRLIEIGQSVRVGIDAFPEKQLNGVITKIANVGEALPTGDAKVFEVEIAIKEIDMDLKPGMTTSNEVIIEQRTNELILPLESIHNQVDSITFVYAKVGRKIIKRQIEPGVANSNSMTILAGLKQGDQVLLNIPENHSSLPFQQMP